MSDIVCSFFFSKQEKFLFASSIQKWNGFYFAGVTGKSKDVDNS